MLIAFGIIIVRSGHLVSVHSFASNTRFGIYIIGVFAILLLWILALYCLRIGIVERSAKMDKMSALKEKFAEKISKYGVMLFFLSAFSILLSIIYPLMFKIFSGIDINMDSGYFHLIFLPLGFVITILAFYSIFLDKGSYSQKIISPLANKNIAMNISHLGIVVMVGAIILNTYYSKDMEFIGKEGGSVNYPANTQVTLQNIKYAKGPNYYRQIAEFWVDIGGKITVLKPENRFYNIENAISAESDIYSYLTQDIYAVIGNIDESKNLYANIYIRPYMAFIWLGMFLTSLGIFVSLLKRR
jgi:cytochrome c-type biogenesis protein CcmF